MRGQTDVDNQPIRVELCAPELHVHDVGGAMQALRGAENFALETMSDHQVIADAECVHAGSQCVVGSNQS